MKIRNVIKEYEAHLRPTESGGAIQGKSEWKHYGDGTYRFKISIRNIPLPDNRRIDVFLDERHFATLDVMSKKAKLDTEDNLSIGIPNIKAGQVVQIKVGELVLAKGQYIEE